MYPLVIILMLLAGIVECREKEPSRSRRGHDLGNTRDDNKLSLVQNAAKVENSAAVDLTKLYGGIENAAKLALKKDEESMYLRKHSKSSRKSKSKKSKSSSSSSSSHSHSHSHSHSSSHSSSYSHSHSHSHSSDSGGSPTPDSGEGGTPSQPTMAPIFSPPGPGEPTRSPAAAPEVSCPFSVLINEFHYQNVGLDITEFVEIAYSSNLNVNGYRVLFYAGATGQPYKEAIISGDTVTASIRVNGMNIAMVPVYNVANPVKDGPDGIALIDGGGTVQEFLSYGGQITATAGPAAGQTSVDIGVVEGVDTSVSYSLQRSGYGYKSADFTWNTPQQSTPGRLNVAQVISCPGVKMTYDPDAPDVKDPAPQPNQPQPLTTEAMVLSMFKSLLGNLAILDFLP